jgi:hypothetical protein
VLAAASPSSILACNSWGSATHTRRLDRRIRCTSLSRRSLPKRREWCQRGTATV